MGGKPNGRTTKSSIPSAEEVGSWKWEVGSKDSAVLSSPSFRLSPSAFLRVRDYFSIINPSQKLRTKILTIETKGHRLLSGISKILS